MGNGSNKLTKLRQHSHYSNFDDETDTVKQTNNIVKQTNNTVKQTNNPAKQNDNPVERNIIYLTDD